MKHLFGRMLFPYIFYSWAPTSLCEKKIYLGKKKKSLWISCLMNLLSQRPNWHLLFIASLHKHMCVFFLVENHGVWQHRRQWGGAQPPGMRALCPEAQHSGSAQGFYCAVVHCSTRETHGIPQGILWEAGEGKNKCGEKLTLTIVKCNAVECR